MLFNQLYRLQWKEWKNLTTIHLLINHRFYLDKTSPIKTFNELNIWTYNYTYGEMVRNILHFIDTTDGLISYVLDGKKVGDSWKKIYVAFNGTSNIKKLQLPKGNWRSFVQNNQLTSSITLPSTIDPFSAIILFEP